MWTKAKRIEHLEESVKDLYEWSDWLEIESRKVWFLERVKRIEEFDSWLKKISLTDQEARLAQDELEEDIESELQEIMERKMEQCEKENQDQMLDAGKTQQNDEKKTLADYNDEFKVLKKQFEDLKDEIEEMICVQKLRTVFYEEHKQEMIEFAERDIPLPDDEED